MIRVPTKIINGILHRKCIECPTWFPYNKTTHIGRCSVCNRKYRREKYIHSRKSGSNNTNRKEAEFNKEMLRKELAGELPVPGLFSGCSDEKIRAMQNRDVQAFLNIN